MLQDAYDKDSSSIDSNQKSHSQASNVLFLDPGVAKQSVNMTDSKGFHISPCILFLSPNGTLCSGNSYCEMIFHGILIRIQYIN